MKLIEVIKTDAGNVILCRNGRTLTLPDDDAVKLAEDIYLRIADYRAHEKAAEAQVPDET